MAEEELGERLVGIDRTEEALLVGRVITALGVLDTAVDYPAAFQVCAWRCHEKWETCRP